MTQRSVLVVLFDGVRSLDVAGPMEVFAGASGFPDVTYELRTASRRPEGVARRGPGETLPTRPAYGMSGGSWPALRSSR